MKTMIAVVTVAALSVLSVPSFASDAAVNQAEKVISLKDGGSLYVFKGGKMALENKFGRATYLKEGQVLETADGRKITATSNEVALLSTLLREGHESH